MKTKGPVGYLNVDLEIEAFSPLNSLSEEMGSAVVVLYCGRSKGRRHLLALESARVPQTPDKAVNLLCGLIERLSSRGRTLWNSARRREFDVGYELPSGARAVRVALKPESIARIASLGATVAFSCYRGDESQANDSTNARKRSRSKTEAAS